MAPLRNQRELAVFDSPPAVVGVKQICPGDDRRYDEELGLKFDVGIIEDLHCREHRLTSFLQEVIGKGTEPSLSRHVVSVPDALLFVGWRHVSFRAARNGRILLPCSSKST